MNYFFKTCRRIVSKTLIWFVYPLYNLFYETFHSDYVLLTASVNPIIHNWGDDVSKQLCKLINPNRKYIIKRYSWNIYKKEDILCIGSIITWMTTKHSTIWGSGIVYPNNELSAFPKKVLAVRGPLTRDYLLKRGIKCPEIFGDPALLFPRFYQPRVKKRYKLGIIPHFRDKKNKILKDYKRDESVLIIDVQNIHPWTKFIDDICSCENIVTSSLHGLIVSDAYGIPNLWVEFDKGESKRFAFLDYLQSVKRTEVEPYLLDSKSSTNSLVEKCKLHSLDIDLDKLYSSCPFL